VIDGGQQKQSCHVMPCEWFASPGFDFVDGAHAGFEHLGVVHRRKVLLVKSSQARSCDYWIVCDLFGGQGTHKVEQFFHLAGPSESQPAEAVIDADAKSVATRNAGFPNVQVVPAPDPDLRVRFAGAEGIGSKPSGKAAALGSPTSEGTRRRVKSSVAVYAKSGELPAAIYQVVFPAPAGGEAEIVVQRMPVTRGGVAQSSTQAAALRIYVWLDRAADSRDAGGKRRGKRAVEWVDYFFISHGGPGMREYGFFEFDGELAFLRQDSQGMIRRALATHATRIQEQYSEIVEVHGRVNHIDAYWDGRAVRVRCPATHGVWTWKQDATRMYLNGADAYARTWGESLFTKSGWRQSLPAISSLKAEAHPAEGGSPGGQPYAVVSWWTNVPATTQVEFAAEGGPVRRTSFNGKATRRHEVRVELLRPGREYAFTVVSAVATGKVSRRTVSARTPESGR